MPTSSASPLPEYPREGIARPPEPCADPRAVLLVSPTGDKRALTWLRQALLAHPEYHVVRDAPRAPLEVRVDHGIYGGKVFKHEEPGDPVDKTALIARCADVATCLSLAAMVRAVVPGSAPRLSCGQPPAVSDNLVSLRPDELAGSAADLPGAADGEGQCARLAACARRRDPAARASERAIDRCRKQGASFRDPCALRGSCEEVRRCDRDGGP